MFRESLEYNNSLSKQQSAKVITDISPSQLSGRQATIGHNYGLPSLGAVKRIGLDVRLNLPFFSLQSIVSMRRKRPLLRDQLDYLSNMI